MRPARTLFEPTDRRSEQRQALIICAEAVIATQGLAGLRARDLAQCVGCAIGTIYNLVGDMDELVLLVARRTMDALAAHLDEAGDARQDPEARLIAWAGAYRAFAVAHRNLWRALFDYRMEGAAFPAWFAAAQTDVFARLETCLADLLPDRDPATWRLRARTLFSAVHGIVALGIEDKLVAFPAGDVDVELAAFVRTYVAGMRTARP